MALTQVHSVGIADGAIVNGDLHNEANVALSKLSTTGTASSSTFLRGDGAWTAVSTDVVGDTSPQLGGDLDINGHDIISATTNQSISINPNGTGDIVLQSTTGAYTQLNGTGGDVMFVGHWTNGNLVWDCSDAQLEFADGLKASFGSDEDLVISYDGSAGRAEIISQDTVHLKCDYFQLISKHTSGRAIYLDEQHSLLELGFDGGHDAHFKGDGVTFLHDVTLNAQSDLRFADSDSSNYVAFQAPATISSNVTWTLPAADGSSGQVLSTNASGTLSWATVDLTNLSAGNLTSGTVSTARLGSGTASTSTFLRGDNSWQTITVPTNNNQLTNGAGYITSADGGNAATLDGVDSVKFFTSYNNAGTTGWQNSNGNFRINSGSSAAGLAMHESDGTFAFQLYGDGGSYGFLNSNWGSWDIRKALNGDMYLRYSGSDRTVWHTGNLSAPQSALYIDVYGSGSTNSRDTARSWATSSVSVPNNCLFGVRWRFYSQFYINNATATIDRDVRSLWWKNGSGSIYWMAGSDDSYFGRAQGG